VAIRYCDETILREKLKNKVRVTDDPSSKPDLMSAALFRRLIEEAEAQFETDLSPRYLPPFQTIAGAAFTQLPDTTKSTLRMLAELKASIHILGTDFGSASASGGDYKKTLEDRYDEQLAKLLEKRSGSWNAWTPRLFRISRSRITTARRTTDTRARS
jgi:hypothetical protein